MPRFNNLNHLEYRRKDLRKNVTEVEQKLWSKIRYQRLGVKFRRQFGVGPYVLDFYCPDQKLAIELDGSQHNDVQRKIYDQERTEYLTSLGIRVIRFWNDEVGENIFSTKYKYPISSLSEGLPLGRGR